MRVVHPFKLDQAGREMIDSDVVALHIERGVPRTEAYIRLGEEQLGVKLQVLQSTRGWRCGMALPMGDRAWGLAPEVRQIANSLRRVCDRLRDKENRVSRDEYPVLAAQIEQCERELLTEYPASLMRRVQERVVFGVSFESVAIALLACELDPTVDVFIRGDEFLNYYTRNDWDHICSAFWSLFPIRTDDPNQLWLFGDAEARLKSAHTRVVQAEVDRFLELGPSVLANGSGD